MLSKLLPDTLVQRFAYAAAFMGIVAAIIGHGNVAWNVQGIATGLYLAALGVMINE